MYIVSHGPNLDLAKNISNFTGAKLIEAFVTKFADGETRVQIIENTTTKEVVIVHSLTHPVNDALIELLLIVDTLKRCNTKSITAVIPYLGYMRQDKCDYNYGPIAAKLIAKLIKESGIDRVITVDLHSVQAEGFFDMPIKNIDPSPLFASRLDKKNKYIVISTDIGGVTRAQNLAKLIEADTAFIIKNRDISGKLLSSRISLESKINGKICILVDDIISTGCTLINSIELLLNRDAMNINIFVSHLICDNKKILKYLDKISQFCITNSIYHANLSSYIDVIDLSELIVKEL